MKYKILKCIFYLATFMIIYSCEMQPANASNYKNFIFDADDCQNFNVNIFKRKFKMQFGIDLIGPIDIQMKNNNCKITFKYQIIN